MVVEGEGEVALVVVLGLVGEEVRVPEQWADRQHINTRTHNREL